MFSKNFSKAPEHIEVWTPEGHITTLRVSWAAKFQEGTFNVRLAQTPLGEWQSVQTDKALQIFGQSKLKHVSLLAFQTSLLHWIS